MFVFGEMMAYIFKYLILGISNKTRNFKSFIIFALFYYMLERLCILVVHLASFFYLVMGSVVLFF